MSLAHLLYGLGWISFGLVHSVLALPVVRAWTRRRVGRGDRLAYNLVAICHLSAVLWAGQALLRPATPFDLPTWLRASMFGLAGSGLVLLVVAGRAYDLGRLTGLSQLARKGADEDDVVEPLVTEGLHAYVRHPLYTGGMALLWGLAHDPFGLATAVWGTFYFLVGTWAEERKLVQIHGSAYRNYRRKVPAFLPWKGRAGH